MEDAVPRVGVEPVVLTPEGLVDVRVAMRPRETTRAHASLGRLPTVQDVREHVVWLPLSELDDGRHAKARDHCRTSRRRTP